MGSSSQLPGENVMNAFLAKPQPIMEVVFIVSVHFRIVPMERHVNHYMPHPCTEI